MSVMLILILVPAARTVVNRIHLDSRERCQAGVKVSDIETHKVKQEHQSMQRSSDVTDKIKSMTI